MLRIVSSSGGMALSLTYMGVFKRLATCAKLSVTPPALAGPPLLLWLVPGLLSIAILFCLQAQALRRLGMKV